VTTSIISPLALSSPRVPSTEANGGLNWTDLYQDPEATIVVAIILPIGDEILLGDRIDLYWQNQALLSTFVDEKAVENRLVSLLVLTTDIIQFGDGEHKVAYEVTSLIGGTTDRSPDTTVLVKTSLPGGADPEAGTPYINEGLPEIQGIPEIIDDSTPPLTVTVPPYENMDTNDAVTLDWGGQRLPPSAPPVANSPVTFPVTRAVLEASAGRVIVRYQIRDRVNNWSKWSRQVNTDVEVGNSFLQAPRVSGPGVVNGEVDLEALGDNDVQVQIPVYTLMDGTCEYAQVQSPVNAPRPFMELDDRVQLIWSGRTADGTVLPDVLVNHTVKQEDIGWPIALSVPNAQVKLIASGYASMRYTVTPTTGLAKYSRRANVPVIGDVRALPTPTVLEASGSVLDPDSLPVAGATVHIDATDLIAVGDQLQVSWSGSAADGSPLVHTIDIVVTGSVAGRPINRSVSRSFVDPLVNGKVDLSYTLYKGDGPVITSPVNTIQIRRAGAQLPAPNVDYAEGGLLDPAKVPADGTTIRVNYVPMQSGETVTVRWEAGSPFSDTFIVPPNWNGREIPFALAKTYVDANLGTTVQVFYTVMLNGMTRTSASQALIIQAAGPSELIDEFEEHDLDLISERQSTKTRYMTIRFVSGTGLAGFDPRYVLPPEADTTLFTNPVLQVSYQNRGSQVIELECDDACTSLSCNVHGVESGSTTVRYLDAARAQLHTQQLPSLPNQTVTYTSPGNPIQYLEITSSDDWTLWDHFVMKF
jgi:hypothetical protein